MFVFFPNRCCLCRESCRSLSINVRPRTLTISLGYDSECNCARSHIFRSARTRFCLCCLLHRSSEDGEDVDGTQSNNVPFLDFLEMKWSQRENCWPSSRLQHIVGHSKAPIHIRSIALNSTAPLGGCVDHYLCAEFALCDASTGCW